MTEPDESHDAPVLRVSSALEKKHRDATPFDRVRDAWTWILVDANRWMIIALLAVLVFAATVIVGAFGPWSQQQYLIEETSIGNAYVDLQSAVITIIALVLTVNQLVLSPDMGPISRQRKRLEDTMAHRIRTENVAGTSPTEPSKFLAELTTATRSQARNLRSAVSDADDPELRGQIEEYVDDVTEEADRISDALAGQRFGRIEMLGAAIHYDTAKNIHQLRQLENEYSRSLSVIQQKAFDDMDNVLGLFAISREYFRTLYIRTEFIQFSRGIIYTGIPAVLVAHYTIGIIAESTLRGSTFGIENLLWFEAGALTVVLMPMFVLASYIARLLTLSDIGLFIGPFVPGPKSEE